MIDKLDREMLGIYYDVKVNDVIFDKPKDKKYFGKIEITRFLIQGISIDFKYAYGYIEKSSFMGSGKVSKEKLIAISRNQMQGFDSWE